MQRFNIGQRLLYPLQMTTNTPAKITPKQAEFARQYLVDLNGAAAARRAGYSVKSNGEATRLLANESVQAEITRLRAELATLADVTPEKVVQELASIAFASMGDYVSIDKRGLPHVDLSGVPQAGLRAIASLSVDEEVERAGPRVDETVRRVRFKLHDKHAALVTLAKTLGMIDKVGPGGTGGIHLHQHRHDSTKFVTLTDEQLRQVLDSGAFDEDGGEDRAIAPVVETEAKEVSDE